MSSIGARYVSTMLVLLVAHGAGLPAIAAPQAAITPVAALYRNFAWAAISSDSALFGGDILSQPATTLARFFDPALVKAIRNDSACQSRTKGICKLDFDILFDSQDPRAVDLTIVATASNAVDVKFKDPVTDKETRITYVLKRLDNEWRITDILYTQHSHRSLRAVLAEHPVRTKSLP